MKIEHGQGREVFDQVGWQGGITQGFAEDNGREDALSRGDGSADAIDVGTFLVREKPA